jgi:hypothetical protein
LRTFSLIVVLFLTQNIGCKPPANCLYPILWKWFQGKADSMYYFSDKTHPTLISQLKTSYQVQMAKNYWVNKNLDTFTNGSTHWLSYTNYLGRFQTIRGLARAGTNMVQQIIGGYTVSVLPISKDSVKFIVHDVKSRKSLFLHFPFVKNRAYDKNRKRQKLMTNIHWYFEWTEPIQHKDFHLYQLTQRLKRL